MPDDPIAGIKGEIVGFGPMMRQVSKAPEYAELGSQFGGTMRGYNDSPVGALAGVDSGNPVYSGPPDEGPAPGFAGDLGDLGELGFLA
jgi:hypothetical protein